ncbi:hypothetical protein MMC12_006790 [Toensbergia leucococca]|nr:hypothetical protein [Toensbergia leucococca]
MAPTATRPFCCPKTQCRFDRSFLVVRKLHSVQKYALRQGQEASFTAVHIDQFITHNRIEGSENKRNILAGQLHSDKKPNLPAPVLSSMARPEASALILALKRTGHGSAVPKERPQKVDLSYTSPHSLAIGGREDQRHAKAKARARAKVDSILKLETPSGTLNTLLARYILHVVPMLDRSRDGFDDESTAMDLDQILLQILDDQALKLLHLKGYEISDLMGWAWILTAQSSEQAAMRLMMLASPPVQASVTARKHIPTFVFLFLLRREQISMRALRLLILHAWHRLEGNSPSGWDGELDPSQGEVFHPENPLGRRWKKSTMDRTQYPKMSETTIMTVFVRLVRQARKVWPAACVSIASMLIKHVNGLSEHDMVSSKGPLDERTSARLTLLYNKALTLLSFPSSVNPFRSVPYHQRAQFNLLRHMNEFEPALTINREGYRAVTRVQLAHKKTLRERDWASMKSKSWPPWKEDKIGTDVKKGAEYGMSRASESMSRAREAGYATQVWENVAEIFAGWDTDGSPTIQKRTVLAKFLHSRRSKDTGQGLLQGEHEGEHNSNIWAARIRATRTLDEAWACFLSHNDRKVPSSHTVYYAMFEKLIFARKRKLQHDEDTPNALHVLPGDGIELCPTPSPREAIYVRTPPPSLHAFFDMMVVDGIKPSGRFLALLLNHALTLAWGFKYLEASTLPSNTIQALLDSELSLNPDTRSRLESIPDYLFAAFIQLLSRFSRPNNNLPRRIPKTGSKYFDPLLHALRLLTIRRTSYRPPWNSVLSVLARSGVTVLASSHADEGNFQDILAWKTICELLRQMQEVDLDLDMQGFQNVCLGLEKAMLASRRVLEHSSKVARDAVSGDAQISSDRKKSLSRQMDSSFHLRFDAAKIMTAGPIRVKAHFHNLIAINSMQPDTDPFSNEWLPKAAPNQADISTLLPNLLDVPNPSQLHAFVRVLGLSGDRAGILELTQWMSRFAPELRAVAEEIAIGQKMMRRCMVAIRVYMERAWEQSWEEREAISDESVGDEGIVEERTSEKDGGEGMGKRATGDMLQRVREVVDGVEEWGGWATEKEVQEYCTKGRF